MNPAHETRAMNNNQPPVPAEAHSDDRVIDFNFDAREWLSEAPVASIIALARCGWGGNRASDQVHYDITDDDRYTSESCKEEHARLSSYLETVNAGGLSDTVGFEVHVNGRNALEWLAGHRPDVWEMCVQEEESDQ